MLYIQRDRDIDITGKQTRFEEKIEKTGREMRQMKDKEKQSRKRERER